MALARPRVRLTAVAVLAVTCLAVAASPAASADRSGHRLLSANGQRGKDKPQHGQRRHAEKRRNARARRASRARRRLSRVSRRSSLGNAIAVGRTAPRSSSSSASDLLFDGSRIADFAQLQAAPDAIGEVQDPLGSGEISFEMTVEDGDVYPVTPTDNPRAQALSPSLIDPGEEIWLRTKFMLPSDFPSVKGWMALVSIYGPPFDGSSPWQIGVHGSELLWQRNGTYDYDVPWRMPLVKGRWVEVLLHERFATDGWVEMWIDGRQVSFPGGAERLSMATRDSSNDGGPNSAKIMQYREAGMFDSATVYFGSLLLGRTRASVKG